MDNIRILEPAPDARIRMVCCPHAGASAGAYAPLARELPGDVEMLAVEYPDRRKVGFDSIEQLADQIAEGLAPWAERPLAVYGHSMGAAVGFELTRRLEAAGAAVPALIVSGRRGPSNGLGPGMPRDDDEIAAELVAMGAVPKKLLEKPKFRESILTVIRHDYGVNSRYRAPAAATVAAPMTFLLADSDVYVDPATPATWRGHTTGAFGVERFHGGHFFLNEQLSAVVSTITAELRAAFAAALEVPQGSVREW